MHIHSRHALRVLAAATLSLAALSAVACGGDDDDDAGSTTSTATTAPTTAGAVGQAASPITTNAPTTVTTAASGGGAYDYYDDSSSGSTPAAGAAALKTGLTAKGTVLTDDKGLTLYTWDTDTTAGKSACNGSCASAWPPVVTTSASAPSVSGASGAFTIITRDDGAKQVAYKGKPLYRFAADSKPGDITGDGVGGTWHLATP